MKSASLRPHLLWWNSLALLILLGMTASAFATKVEVAHGRLHVDGIPFTVKGVTYHPVPIGVDPEITPPYGDYYTPEYGAIYERDLPLGRQMKANVVRLLEWATGVHHWDLCGWVHT